MLWARRCQGDEIVASVELTDVRADKPITKLRTQIVRSGDDVVVLDGTAACFTDPVVAAGSAA